MPTYDELTLGAAAVTRDQTRAVFGQVMGLVALTVGCAALGAYIGRNLTGGTGIAMLRRASPASSASTSPPRAAMSSSRSGCCSAWAAARARRRPGARLLREEPTRAPSGSRPARPPRSSPRSARSGTRLGVTSRSWARALFWALLALIAFGIVGIFVAIPHANVIYAVDRARRLRRRSRFSTSTACAAPTMAGAVPIAAGIFLDIFNVFLFMLRLFGGGRD